MSTCYQVMDTSVNFMEEMEHEYNTESQFIQNVSYNDDQVQIVEREEREEQSAVNEKLANDESLEEEVPVIKYQEADALIRDEIKEIILKKETEKVTLTVLTERKNIIIDQIKTLQDIRLEVERNIGELNISLDVEKDELQYLQKRALFNGEIVGKLIEPMTTVQNAYKQQVQQRQQIAGEVATQKEKVIDLQTWEKRIVQLKSRINETSSKGDTDKADDVKSEHLLLKARLLENQEYLGELKKRCQQIESRKENLSHLVKGKHNLKGIFSDQKIKIEEFKELKTKYNDRFIECSKEWDLMIKKKGNELSSWLETAANLKNKLKDMAEIYEKRNIHFSTEEDRKISLEDKIKQISTKLRDHREEIQLRDEKWKKEIELAQNQIMENESKLIMITKGNEELDYCLENLKKQYIDLLEEKSEKLELKQQLEDKLKIHEELLNKTKWLDEKLAKKQDVVNELTRNLEVLSSDNRLQEFEKRKDYVLTSTDYLKEKFENVQKQAEGVRMEYKAAEECMESNKNIIQENEKLIDNLLQELEDIKNGTEKFQTPSPGILKSPTSYKKSPISPKRVKFQGFPSDSSSSQSVNSSGGQNTPKKSLDEVLDQIEGRIFKKPT